MRPVLEIIAQEYRRYIFTRGFLLFLLFIPATALIGGFLGYIQAATIPVKSFVVLDRSGGGYEETLRGEVEVDRQRRTLAQWDEFVGALIAAGAIEAEALGEPFAPGERTRARREAFFEAGGTEAGVERLEGLTDAEVPAFTEPKQRFAISELPQGLPSEGGADTLGEAYAPYLSGDRKLEDGGRLNGVLIIPEGFGGDQEVRLIYITENFADDSVPDLVRGALTSRLREDAYVAEGVSEEEVRRISRLSVGLRTVRAGTDAADDAQRLRDRIETVVPLALSYILFFAAFSTGSMLLTNTIEEKSNKIVEMLLSSVSAGQLMFGKLIGMMLVGLTPLAVFTTVGLIAIIALGGGNELVSALGDVLIGSPLIPLFFVYFILGYLLSASIYLAIGSLCETIQDAQNLSTPLTLVLLLPAFLIVGVVEDPNGIIARVMTWVPLYTHYALMLRLSAEPPLWEVVGATAMLVVVVLLMIAFMGRIYRAGILQSGSNANWKAFLDAARAPKEATVR